MIIIPVPDPITQTVVIYLANERTPEWMFPVIQLNGAEQVVTLASLLMKCIEVIDTPVPECIRKEFQERI